MPLPEFYPAGEYHQNIYALHRYMGYIVANDTPALKRLHEQFPDWYQ